METTVVRPKDVVENPAVRDSAATAMRTARPTSAAVAIAGAVAISAVGVTVVWVIDA